MYLLIGAVSILIGGLIMFLCLRPKLKQRQSLDEEIRNENLAAEQKAILLQSEIKQSQDLLAVLLEQAEKEKQNTSNLLQIKLEAIDSECQLALQTTKQKLKELKEECKNDYLFLQEDYCKDFQLQAASLLEKKSELESEYNRIFSIVKAATEANIRAEEIKNQNDFYRLCLSEDDVEEISKLREVGKILRDDSPLNKVIWKVYYERPTNDLINRVVGPDVKTGIYKITNLENQMCYVGQALNIGDRWKQHIKKGVGADVANNNKLYPAMLELGPENFSFEIIEECPRESLNEREQFWQTHFGAKIFGYSLK